jgi:hypothetical protein
MSDQHVKPHTQYRWGLDVEAPVVWLADYWEDDWGSNGNDLISPWLRVDYVEWGANPKIHSVGLSCRYGIGCRDGQTEEAVAASNLAGKLVKVFVPYQAFNAATGLWQTAWRHWFGIIVEQSDAPDGSYPSGKTVSPSEHQPSGVQHWIAYGLEWILQQMLIGHSVVATSEGGVVGQTVVKKALAFNAPTPRCEDGNRAVTGQMYGTSATSHISLFSSDALDMDTASWSTYDIVNYLLAVFTGQSGWDIGEWGTRIPFRLSNDAWQVLPTWDKPLVETEGKTVLEVLNTVLDRRRLLGYRLEMDEEQNAVVLQPFTFTKNRLELDAALGAFIEPNGDTAILDCSAALDVEGFSLQTTIARKYDKVIVRGHPIVCCGTISTHGGILVPHWTTADQTAYRTAASTDAGYPADDCDREKANKTFRARDAMSRVYSWFGLPREWAGECGDGGTGNFYELFPIDAVAPRSGTTPEFSPWYWPELRFLPKLPLLDVDTVPDMSKREYRSMFAIVSLTATRYALLDKLADSVEPTDDLETNWSGHVRPQTEAPGIILTTSGKPQHVIAKGQWTAIDASENTEDAVFDYRDDLLVTVAMAAAWCAEAEYPDNLWMDNRQDFRSVLQIDYTAGHHGKARGRVWWIAPETVLGLKPDQSLLRESAEGRFEKDERPIMAAVARLVYRWFSRDRRALALSVKQPFFDFFPGCYILGLIDGAETLAIDSVVTELRVDFTGDVPRTTIHTECGELDVLRFE